MNNENIIWHDHQVNQEERSLIKSQVPCILWFTGLSGSGKSTIARVLERKLMDAGHLAMILDGDNVRMGLNRDLGFSAEDRSENIRRIAEVAKLMNDSGVIVVTAFISPYQRDRASAAQTIGDQHFLEVHVDAPLSVCEERDPKGLYRKARAGEIAQFTGVDAPYEAPDQADDLVLVLGA